MGFWNFLCGFAVFNAVCNLFSSKQNRTDSYSQCHYVGYDDEDYRTFGAGSSCLDDYLEEMEDLQYEIDDLQDELDELHEELDELHEELDELHEELEDLDMDSYLYDDYVY